MSLCWWEILTLHQSLKTVQYHKVTLTKNTGPFSTTAQTAQLDNPLTRKALPFFLNASLLLTKTAKLLHADSEANVLETSLEFRAGVSLDFLSLLNYMFLISLWCSWVDARTVWLCSWKNMRSDSMRIMVGLTRKFLFAFSLNYWHHILNKQITMKF